MLYIKRSLPIIILFLIGTVLVWGIRAYQVKQTVSPELREQSSYSFDVPSESIRGRVVRIEGVVQKEPREEDELKDAPVGTEILQGERLVTQEESKVAVEFEDFVDIGLGPLSEIRWIHTLKDTFLIEQKTGSLQYIVKDGVSLSVRSLHILLSFNPGEYEVVTDGDEITVRVISGNALLAIVDLDNATHVLDLEEGDIASVDDRERRVEIR